MSQEEEIGDCNLLGFNCDFARVKAGADLVVGCHDFLSQILHLLPAIRLVLRYLLSEECVERSHKIFLTLPEVLLGSIDHANHVESALVNLLLESFIFSIEEIAQLIDRCLCFSDPRIYVSTYLAEAQLSLLKVGVVLFDSEVKELGKFLQLSRRFIRLCHPF